MKKLISLAEIVLDKRLHARSGGMKPAHVEDLVLAYEHHAADVETPRVWVLQGRVGYFLTRGHHRVKAMEKRGAKKVECEVRNGDLADAVLDAATGDLGHGLKRSAEDKRRCVEMVLGIHPDWTDRVVAEKVDVSPTFVGEVRSSVVHVDNTDAKSKGKTMNPPRRTGRDGRSYKAEKPSPVAPPPAPKPVKHETPPLIPDPDEQVRELHDELIQTVGTLPVPTEANLLVWKAVVVKKANELVILLGLGK